MKKLFSRTIAALLTSALIFTSTGFSSSATIIEDNSANVVTEITTDEQETEETVSTNDIEEITTDEAENVSENDVVENTTGETETSSVNEVEQNTSDEKESSSMAAINPSTTASELNEAADYTWKSITFGQSTDLNFPSNVLPEKIGTQYAEETQISVVDSSVEGAEPETKDAVVIESRGGKIANAHDGLTFYYTTLPTSKNFVLEAKVFINQFGPENNSAPSKQEAVGIMARDILGAARQEPMAEGYEELPAASNVASTMVMANEKKTNTALNIMSYQRNGVFYPYGNAHISYSATQFAQINADKSKTVIEDVTPAEGESYDSSDFFTLRLERTDNGFITTYIASDGTEKTGSIDDADRLAVIDEENMYVGFFSSRNAKVTYTDITLTTSNANTAPCTFTPEAYALSFTNMSAEKTSSSDYTVAFRTNFDGTAEILQDGSVIEAAGAVTAGEIYELPTTLSSDTTNFVINYSSSNGSKTVDFNVTKNEAYQKDLYVSVDGTSSGSGDIDSPLDLDTALSYLSEGHTIYLREGTYNALVIQATMSASTKGMKSLTAYNGENVVFSGNSYVYASYWNISHISITGSNSAGLRASGSGNVFEYCTFYGNEDTGFQLGMGSDTDPLTWPENNTIRYCLSYENVDASQINADGFAAKLGVGKGNLFDSCISHDNADDGWDLFNKLGDAKNEPVTIQNCIAYSNGNNGFKLGGEGYAVDHIITDCLAFQNNMDGFTDNFNTGVLTVTNCTSVDNNRYNYIFRLNPYLSASEQGTFTNNISYRSSYDEDTVNDYISGNIVNSYFFDEGNNTITANDFISTTAPESYERNADGTINYGDFMRPTTASFLANSGISHASYIGAIPPVSTPAQLVTKISLDKTQASLKIGETVALKASVEPANATNSALTWTSSNTGVASVDSTGLVKALSAGTAVISAASTDGSNITAACAITVLPDVVGVSSITLTKTKTAIAKGSSETLSASVLPENATDTSVTWSSSNTKVATVDQNGKVTGKAYGTAVIKAASVSNPSITASCSVTVGYKITYSLNKGANNSKNPAAYYKQKVTLSEPTRKGYLFKGWYTDSKFKTKITSISKSSTKNYKLYAKWEKVSKPAAPAIKAATNSSAKKMKITLKSSISGAKGYEITYATDKKFTKNTSTATISKASTLSKTISKLTKGSTYYVKVRAYTVDSEGNKIYGKYSKTVSVKIRK
ncbi:Ig-like domain-containing protein [Konateibacter massiliensis]|uniref:Ig-like domain-containing protein n=1 Tax=Konateibacter massiliensis TaxID=2002841 RepID=UPI000C1563E9|nr:Ig-like domain-containing protein [Konateibacter massiliensis]